MVHLCIQVSFKRSIGVHGFDEIASSATTSRTSHPPTPTPASPPQLPPNPPPRRLPSPDLAAALSQISPEATYYFHDRLYNFWLRPTCGHPARAVVISVLSPDYPSLPKKMLPEDVETRLSKHRRKIKLTRGIRRTEES